MGLDGLERLALVHEAQVLQFSHVRAQHAGGADVEEGQDPRLGHLDDVLSEGAERERASRARVHDGGRAGAETVRIGLDAVVGGAGEDVHVQVDEARRDEEVGRVEDVLARDRTQINPDGRDASPLEPHVVSAVESLGGVEYPAASDQHVSPPILEPR